MGDGEQREKYLQLLEADGTTFHSDPTSIKISYQPGPKKWAGIYWLNLEDNWGDEPGENLSSAGYERLTFWARGAIGKEVVEFTAGGVRVDGKPHRDSFKVKLGKVALSAEWKQYTIDLKGQDLGSVIGGFSWTANKSANPAGLTFWLDDVRFE
jgi:hypothetical protein